VGNVVAAACVDAIPPDPLVDPLVAPLVPGDFAAPAACPAVIITHAVNTNIIAAIRITSSPVQKPVKARPDRPEHYTAGENGFPRELTALNVLL